MKSDNAMKINTSTVNLFIVYSPLHCLCAEQIALSFENNAKNILFYLKPEFESLLNITTWDSITYLPWPRFDPMPGFFGRIRQTKKNLYTVAKFCQGAQRIVLHTTVIDTEAINYYINFLRKKFPSAEFNIRLFPDGLMNIRRHPISLFKELLQYTRLIRRIIYPEIHYYRFKGDRTGSDDLLVDKIYVLSNFPHQYNSSKVTYMPKFESLNGIGYDSILVQKRALVIGQPLIAYRRMTKEQVKIITKGIYDYLQACGIEDIFYKSHPRDNTREYALDGYKELILSKPLEQHLAEHPYGIVIGVCSTGLLTGRMILPNWCRVISYGINMMIFNNIKEKKELISIFNQLEVDIINCSNQVN